MKKEKNSSKQEHAILLKATVVYTDGTQEQFKAIQTTPKGILIGKTQDTNKKETFYAFGFIPNQSIKKIEGNENKKKPSQHKP